MVSEDVKVSQLGREAVPGGVVLPGQVIQDASSTELKKVTLGPGVERVKESVVACNSGILKKSEPNIYYVDNLQKRYTPVRRECVIGVVVMKAGDIFKVDINASEQASLSYLAFENVSKKNRPRIEIGDLVFAQILTASKDMEPELVCVNSYGKQVTMGVLPTDGFLFLCSINLIHKILNSKCPLLTKLGKRIPYETAIGMNGRIWIKAKTVDATLLIGNAILQSEYASAEAIEEICENLLKKLPNVLN